MNFSKIFKVASGILLLSLLSCNSTGGQIEPDSDAVNVLFAVDSFEDTQITKTIVTDVDRGTIHWVDGDVIGIFPYEGYQQPFQIPADQINQADAIFDGGHWALKSGLEYNAYYPFEVGNFVSPDMKKQVPLDYTGQSQYGAAINTGRYDFTYSDWQTAPASGSVNFKFHHIGSLVVMNVEYPVTAEFTKLGFSIKKTHGDKATGDDPTLACIPVTGTFDLTYNHNKEPEQGQTYVKIPYVGTSNADYIGIDVYNEDGTAGISGTKGETATFYMMVPPMDLTALEEGWLIRFELIAADSTVYQCAVYPVNFQSGKKYTLTLTPVKSWEDKVVVTPEIGNWEDQSGSATPPPVFE